MNSKNLNGLNNNFNKMNRIFLLLLLATTFILTIGSCGKTELDEEREEMLVGRWGPYDENDDLVNNLPYYQFNEKNSGYTQRQGFTTKDKMKWEIKKDQLRVYYDKAPSGYIVAYDQYHSRSVYRIVDFKENKVRVVMYLYTGLQREFYLRRINENNELIVQ